MSLDFSALLVYNISTQKERRGPYPLSGERVDYMVYSEISIQLLIERLISKAFNDRTPRKYATDMFEAAEVIQQLQKESKELKKQLPKKTEE